MRHSFCIFSICSLFFFLFSGRVEAQDAICFNLHNSLVEKYITNAETYTNTIGTTGESILEDYNEYINLVGHADLARKSNWAEQPTPVVLEGLQGTKVLISDKPTFSVSFEFPIDSEGRVTAYNLIPQKIYWYKTVDSKNVTINKGVFKTTGQVRMIRVENALNIRDLGGWSCGNGFRIAYGKLYRGATLDGVHPGLSTTNYLPISDSDARMLSTVAGIKAEADLRGKKYDTGTSSILNADYSYFSSYIYNAFVTGDDKYAEIQKSLNYIAGNLKNGKPTYFHCEWGSDRTGSLAMIIGAICGVSESELVKDWELSSFANYYDFKIISDVKEDEPRNMRAMFQTLYDNYGGASGNDIQSQVISWLTNTVYKNAVDSKWSAQAVISTLQSKLVEADTQSPKLIREWSDKYDNFVYSVVTDEQSDLSKADYVNKYLLSDGKTGVSDMCCVSGYINCSNYSKLLVNLKCNLVCVFYDSNKKKVSSIVNSGVEAGTVLMKDAEYTIPSNAKYVRFNMPKYSGFTAVLSNQSYLE